MTTQLQSSNLAWCDYKSKTQTLIIGFHQDFRVYAYYGVPEWVFLELVSAPSAGQYHRAKLYFGYKRNALGQWRRTEKGVEYDEITGTNASVPD